VGSLLVYDICCLIDLQNGIVSDLASGQASSQLSRTEREGNLDSQHE